LGQKRLKTVQARSSAPNFSMNYELSTMNSSATWWSLKFSNIFKRFYTIFKRFISIFERFYTVFKRFRTFLTKTCAFGSTPNYQLPVNQLPINQFCKPSLQHLKRLLRPHCAFLQRKCSLKTPAWHSQFSRLMCRSLFLFRRIQSGR